jgi:protein required for attachment to host cells
MRTTWIISANAGRARIFSDTGPAEPLREVEDMINEAVRLRTMDTESDKIDPTAATSSGHGIGGNQGAGPGNSGKAGAPNKQYQPAHTPADHKAEQFARNISRYLVDAYQQNQFEQLIVSASPHFLGTLRSLMDPRIKPLITLELNKDYTQVNAHELRGQLDLDKGKLH